MSYMFKQSTIFISDFFKLDLTNVKNIEGIFQGLECFHDISKLNVNSTEGIFDYSTVIKQFRPKK